MINVKKRNYTNTAIVDPDPTTLLLTVLAALANVAQIASWYDGRRKRRQSEDDKVRKGKNKKRGDLPKRLTSMEDSCDSIRRLLEKLAWLLDMMQDMSVSDMSYVVLTRGQNWRAAPFLPGEVSLNLPIDQFKTYFRIHMELIIELRRLAINSYIIMHNMESENINISQDSINLLQECRGVLQKATVSENYNSALESLTICANRAQEALEALRNSFGDDDVPRDNGGPAPGP